MRDILRAWSTGEGTIVRPWFRGHGCADWSLLPTLFRLGYGYQYDEEFRHDFRRRASQYLAGSDREPRNDWEWYFLMQHYGLPTRLLDWSESALIALYFAVRDNVPKSPAAVWMVDPWWINRHIARRGDRLFMPHEREIQAFLEPPFERKKRLPKLPIAIQPPHTSHRIAAQKGAFTIHGWAGVPLEAYQRPTGRLVKITIPAAFISTIRDDLWTTGIGETTIFPDLSGLCRELLQYWTRK